MCCSWCMVTYHSKSQHWVSPCWWLSSTSPRPLWPDCWNCLVRGSGQSWRARKALQPLQKQRKGLMMSNMHVHGKSWEACQRKSCFPPQRLGARLIYCPQWVGSNEVPSQSFGQVGHPRLPLDHPWVVFSPKLSTVEESLSFHSCSRNTPSRHLLSLVSANH